jgi:hypothetical protein
MITKSYKRAVIGAGLMSHSAVVTDYKGVKQTVESMQYSNRVDGFWDYGVSQISSLTSNPRGIGFISGGTEPTDEDYKTDGTLISGLTFSYTRERNVDENGTSVTITYTITNGNSETVTIDEVCWYACVFYLPSNAHYTLADRTRLKNPVTIEAGGIGQIPYTVGATFDF